MRYRSAALGILALYGCIALALLWDVPDLIARLFRTLPYILLLW